MLSAVSHSWDPPGTRLDLGAEPEWFRGLNVERLLHEGTSATGGGVPHAACDGEPGRPLRGSPQAGGQQPGPDTEWPPPPPYHF
eukprot:CAMPEP_0179329676 /NCGR_PEP_ID=MMETSP0797-20121207/63255_1 /TAXON_ID=47934 /ORGANISM="Dinophysis acuminata, Strain DAEP01" /LENGTH=83 /DNA_ID=CAMNT_0021042349 /DNA_START=30 /DNA_END=278 /DNA_ORIENTATION=+